MTLMLELPALKEYFSPIAAKVTKTMPIEKVTQYATAVLLVPTSTWGSILFSMKNPGLIIYELYSLLDLAFSFFFLASSASMNWHISSPSLHKYSSFVYPLNASRFQNTIFKASGSV